MNSQDSLLRTPFPASGSDMMVEPKPDASADEIFLSPRVIDSAAFNEFAQRLRSLINQADISSQKLRDTMGQAAEIGKSLDASAAAQKERLQAAVKVLRAIDAVGSPSVQNARFDPAELREIIEKSKQELECCADELLVRIERDAKDAVRSVSAQSIKLNTVLSRAASAKGQLNDSAEQAQNTSALLTSQGRSLVSLNKRITDALENLEEAAAQATASSRQSERDDPIETIPINTPKTGTNEISDPNTGKLASLCSQAQQLKDELAKSILEGGAQLDELNTRRRKLAQKVRDAILACQHAERSLLKTTQRVNVQALVSSSRPSDVLPADPDPPSSSSTSSES